MIILGDIASANKDLSESIQRVFQEHPSIFRDNSILYNQEGLIADNYESKKNKPVLFSHSELLSTIKQDHNPVVAALANNHTLDLPDHFKSTIDEFRKNDVEYVGAGPTKEEALKPATFNEEGKQIFVFNYCWNFLLYHQKNPSKSVHVAEISENAIISRIKKQKETHPRSSIIVYFHWSLDMETLPYPMYREFAKALIDAGADVVAGSHSHCVQGGETYGDGYIVYGLGNFFIPWNVYAGGKLSFPDLSRVTLALEWDPENQNAYCHWFEYRESDHSLKLLESEPFENSSRLKEYTPYENMQTEEYESYFRTNRRKDFLIPVYVDYRKEWLNRYLTFLLKMRARIARMLARLNLINWQN